MKKYLSLLISIVSITSLSAMAASFPVVAPPETIHYNHCPFVEHVGQWLVQPSRCTFGAKYVLTLGYSAVGEAIYIQGRSDLTGYVYTLTLQPATAQDFPYTIVNYQGNIVPDSSDTHWNWNKGRTAATCPSQCRFVVAQ